MGVHATVRHGTSSPSSIGTAVISILSGVIAGLLPHAVLGSRRVQDAVPRALQIPDCRRVSLLLRCWNREGLDMEAPAP
jgi:hypothetical protein